MPMGNVDAQQLMQQRPDLAPLIQQMMMQGQLTPEVLQQLAAMPPEQAQQAMQVPGFRGMPAQGGFPTQPSPQGGFQQVPNGMQQQSMGAPQAQRSPVFQARQPAQPVQIASEEEEERRKREQSGFKNMLTERLRRDGLPVTPSNLRDAFKRMRPEDVGVFETKVHGGFEKDRGLEDERDMGDRVLGGTRGIGLAVRNALRKKKAAGDGATAKDGLHKKPAHDREGYSG